MICYATKCIYNRNDLCTTPSKVTIDEDGYCESMWEDYMTICGETNCEGCLYQHLNDIELCKREVSRKISVGV